MKKKRASDVGEAWLILETGLKTWHSSCCHTPDVPFAGIVISLRIMSVHEHRGRLVRSQHSLLVSLSPPSMPSSPPPPRVACGCLPAPLLLPRVCSTPRLQDFPHSRGPLAGEAQILRCAEPVGGPRGHLGPALWPCYSQGEPLLV